jgi:hypothetical protein
MGKIRFHITYKGVSIDSFKNNSAVYNQSLTLENRYNFPAIEKITIDRNDIEIPLDVFAKNDIDWTKYDLPQHVVAIINDLEHYQSIKDKLESVYTEMEYLEFEDKYKMDALAQKAIDIIDSLQHSAHLDNFMLNKTSWIKKLFHTKNKEVSMLLRLKDKDAKYKKAKMLEDAKKHLLPDIKSVIHFLQEGKIKVE